MFAEDPPVFCFDYVPEYSHEFTYLSALATAQKSKKCGFDRGNTTSGNGVCVGLGNSRNSLSNKE
jgi:hypothetical protein